VLIVPREARSFACWPKRTTFAREVEIFRSSQEFQRFLTSDSASTRRIPLERLEAEIEWKLAAQGKTA